MPPVRTESVPLRDIDLSGSFQPRERVDPERAAHYAFRYLGGEDFPPVVVFGWNLRKPFYLADGFTRLEAHKINVRAGHKEYGHITAEIRGGGSREAEFFALAANIRNGYPLSNLDKRKSVLAMLSDGTWGNPYACPNPECEAVRRANEDVNKCRKCKTLLWTDQRIADHCGVSKPFVWGLRKELDSGEPVHGEQAESGADPSKWWKETSGYFYRFRLRIEERYSEYAQGLIAAAWKVIEEEERRLSGGNEST